MSGVVKGVKKVFKKVGTFVKKHWKKIVIAAAVAVTAGMAIGAFGSGSVAAGTAASTAAQGAGFTAGAVGAGTGAGAGAGAAAGAGAGALATATGASTVAGYLSGGAAMTSAGASYGVLATTTGTAAGAALKAGATVAKSGVLSSLTKSAVQGWKSMSAFEKVMTMQTVASFASGLLAPKPKEPPENFFGYDKHGKGPGLRIRFDPQTSSFQYVEQQQTPQQKKSADAPAELPVNNKRPSRGEREDDVDEFIASAPAEEFIAPRKSAMPSLQKSEDLNAPDEMETEQTEFIKRGYRSGSYGAV